MVAYSFKKDFIAPIKLGLIHPVSDLAKMQTIRSDRKRHARPGERIQLYYAMRTKHCAKIIPDPICTKVVHDLQIMVEASEISHIRKPGHDLRPASFDAFARRDGFMSIELMHQFWLKSHGAGLFRGVLIYWNPTTAMATQEASRAA